MKTTVIGIAGGTGSGKSTFTNRLKAAFGDQVAVLDTSTPGWYQVLFASGSAPVKGWVSADYLVLL